MTLDGNALYTRLDPRTGARIAVAEACRNLACVGARPIGVTNCLNFGNPEKPEVMGQFEQAVDGPGRGLPDLRHPGHGRQRQLLQRHRRPVHPSRRPCWGSSASSRTSARPSPPDSRPPGTPSSSSARATRSSAGRSTSRSSTGSRPGRRPRSTSNRRSATRNLLLEAIEAGLVRSAHDLSEGGLAVALAESAFHGGRKLGCAVDLDGRPPRRRPALRRNPVPHPRHLPPQGPRPAAANRPAPGACRPGRSAARAGPTSRSSSAGREILRRPGRNGVPGLEERPAGLFQSPVLRRNHGRGRLPQSRKRGRIAVLLSGPRLELHGHPRGGPGGPTSTRTSPSSSATRRTRPASSRPARAGSRRSSSTPSSSPRARSTTGRSPPRSSGGGSTSSAWPDT